ncbi:lasso peptide biosynthesis B2 protein [Pseudomonas aeruginosa]|uniref:lasso peptide biosynthesis B2 protein n=1 Tax=Pseudomonas aeruginosa TaxID=287 RepID=UPI00163C66F3|nr:lasso peptide biosynthesis B2 protein [Pseudomonas aeruginosa]MBG4922315.1 lasso peptide biosynthesis B2 protein [Pseudomonas aeruginosa]MBG5864628.1 lasso peptide biosynthesis B2 protein [Pseudomonas aeruginosa]HDU8925428.1 lasso peptide biosynthesis B2 protein [Pseudomonas aeruginosa]HDU9094087.1 lasso peptide biosynthesis B2 protein [Pseudomonas aeruginosa]HEJ1200429.1 lasso peptide biosynthesis B2 protein [Pseudomonas aeruginosa]
MGELEPTRPYLLSSHAHVCVASGVVVLLDVDSGKYLSIGKQQAVRLGNHILGWPMQADSQGGATILQSLIDRRLVTRNPAQGRPATPATITLPTRWIREGEPRGQPDFRLRDMRRFAVAVAFAVCYKKLVPFKSIVARAQRRVSRKPQELNQLDYLALLVRLFDWLRPLAFKKTDECFLYCFALSEFLAQYGFFPSWVFAVSTDPFTAHCWLQHNDYVLTDVPFNLRRMAPILVL